jgi:hypothetical protein
VASPIEFECSLVALLAAVIWGKSRPLTYAWVWVLPFYEKITLIFWSLRLCHEKHRCVVTLRSSYGERDHIWSKAQAGNGSAMLKPHNERCMQPVFSRCFCGSLILGKHRYAVAEPPWTHLPQDHIAVSCSLHRESCLGFHSPRYRLSIGLKRRTEGQQSVLLTSSISGMLLRGLSQIYCYQRVGEVRV